MDFFMIVNVYSNYVLCLQGEVGSNGIRGRHGEKGFKVMPL